MAFTDTFHQITDELRLNGGAIVYASSYTVDGGLFNGVKALEISIANDPNITLYETTKQPQENEYFIVADRDAAYQALYSQGMLQVFEGVLVNGAAISRIQYNDAMLLVDVLGSGGRYTFRANPQVSAAKALGGGVWEIPALAFPTFRDDALQLLSTLPSGTQASSYIALAGSDDFINFTGGNTATGYLDWTKDWTIGITVVGYPQHSDSKYQCLFASGNNVIMIRRGGTNQSLYIASNNTGYASQGINTWQPINDGDRIQFEHVAASNHLRYFKGQAGQTPTLVGVLTVNAANIAANDPGDDFAIGRGNGLTNYEELLAWDGGLNNFVGQSSQMGTSNRLQYFEAIGEAFDELPFYDDLASWAKLGEDVYPLVTDTKGALTGGELMNGTPEDFVVIDSPDP